MTPLAANGLLLLTSAIWGSTFVAQRWGMDSVGPITYTGVRFLLGALIVLPLALWEYRQLRRRAVQLGVRDVLLWCLLGGLLFAGAWLQQVGVMSTTVTNAGFLTALYVPLVPLLGWVMLGQRPSVWLWPCMAGSVVGTVALGGGQLAAFGMGDAWVLASTLFWALHVLLVGRWVRHTGAPLLLACTQFATCGLLGMALAMRQETVTWAGLQQGWATIAYAGVLSVGVAFTLQVVAQRHTRAADAAILLSAEIVFAAIAGWLMMGERLDAGQILGGVLIFASIVLVQLVPARATVGPRV
jgi:drug/metabolite transporter (DMT)-like permease